MKQAVNVPVAWASLLSRQSSSPMACARRARRQDRDIQEETSL